MIVTDSGGIQEEATAPALRKKVLVLRTSTERIEAVKSGYSEIIGINSSNIRKMIQKNFDKPLKLSKNPYGNGRSSEKIINILKKNF